MDILFKTKRLGKICNDSKRRIKEYGPDCGRKLAARLDDLRAAPTLEAMRNLPGKCHELKADKKGQLALKPHGALRLIFVPAHDPVPEKPDGGIDWSKVTCITIVGIEDYHG